MVMRKNHDYAAFFDLDRTIINLNSGELLVRQAYKNGLMSKTDILKGFYFTLLYKLDLKPTEAIIEGMARWMAGLPETAVIDLSREIFKKYLIHAIRPEIYKAIQFHKERNGEVVILSASMPYICSQFESHLGLDTSICSELEVVDGKFTGRPVGRFCFGKEKVSRLTRFCELRKYRLSEAYYYADSISDYDALKIVGNPVCVRPDKKLTAAAQLKGWNIYYWQ